MPATVTTTTTTTDTNSVTPVIASRNGVTVRGFSHNHYFIVDPDMPQEAFDNLCAKWERLLEDGFARTTTGQDVSLWQDYYNAIRADYIWSHEYADRYELDEGTRAAYKARFAAKAAAFIAILEFVRKGENAARAD